MVITAKFASKCGGCGGTIHAGDKIEWSKGVVPRHARCVKGSVQKAHATATPKARPVTRAPRRPSFPTEPPEPGAHRIEGRRSDRRDSRYDVGSVVHAPKVKIEGGGPDRHYYTVLAAVMYPPNEDNGQYGWVECAWVRASTDEEAAPVAARLTSAADRKAMLAELDTLARAGWTGSDDTAAKPAGREVVLDAGTHGSGRRIALLSEDGGAVAVWCGGYYDDYRPTLEVTRDPRAVEIVTKLLG